MKGGRHDRIRFQGGSKGLTQPHCGNARPRSRFAIAPGRHFRPFMAQRQEDRLRRQHRFPHARRRLGRRRHRDAEGCQEPHPL